MIYHETGVEGAYLIEPDRHPDERGHFARLWCAREFRDRGLNPNLAQASYSSNFARGTLRGLHYQTAPFEEAKLVRCTSGALYDVALDLRPSSPTYLRHFGATLSHANGRMLYVPEGCAHGYLTLEDNSEALYFISQFHAPEAAHGVRWNDPAFQIQWPGEAHVISVRDRHYEDYRP